MAAARIRKAFRYPDDKDDELLELDEEEQEKLIADLQQQDTDNIKLYRTIFPIMPACAALFTLVTLFTAESARQSLIAMLSLSSLAITSYIFVKMPLAAPDKKGKRPVYLSERDSSPIARYLPWLNIALAALLLISAVSHWRRDQIALALREGLPAVILCLTLFVREQLRPVDWNELHQARYELKGA